MAAYMGIRSGKKDCLLSADGASQNQCTQQPNIVAKLSSGEYQVFGIFRTEDVFHHRFA